MEIFLAAAAFALAVSTCTGLIMGWKHARGKSIVLLILAAGIVIPVILFFVEPFPSSSIAE
jgi:ABC-type spermidine/putrescine transport system permease subunit II